MEQHFRSTLFVPHSVIPSHIYRTHRPTVSVVLVGQSDKVAFVQSAKDANRRTWVLPQGGIRGGESVDEAVRREIAEELGISVTGGLTMLGEFVNTLPPDRGAQKPKLMCCVAVRIFDTAAVLNHENIKVEWRSDEYGFWHLMGDMSERRPLKFTGMCHALIEAKRQGFISWSCEALLDHISEAA